MFLPMERQSAMRNVNARTYPPVPSRSSPRSGGLERHAFLRMELDENRVAHGSAQRRMAAREQNALAELHLEIVVLAEEHLLVDPRLPHVRAFGPSFGEIHVLGPHR